MLYIQESLAPGEKILKYTQYHWMYIALSAFSATFFVLFAFLLLFLGVIYHYYDIVKVPPWMIMKAASQLSFNDYIKAIWHTNIIIRTMAFLMFFMAVVQIGARLLVRMTTEMGVTNRRVILKRGLISRKVEEMRVDFIDGADVDQTILGRIFNYGRIKMYGTGVEGIQFPQFMNDPVNFRRAVQAARAVQISRPGAVPSPEQEVVIVNEYDDPHPILNQNHHSMTREELENIRIPGDTGPRPN